MKEIMTTFDISINPINTKCLPLIPKNMFYSTLDFDYIFFMVTKFRVTAIFKRLIKIINIYLYTNISNNYFN